MSRKLIKIYVNGRFFPEKRAVVSVFDRGFLYGDGVYETIRVYDGHPFRIDDHLKRLKVSLQGIGLLSRIRMGEIKSAIMNLIDVNQFQSAVIRVTVTRGSGPRGFLTTGCRQPSIVVAGEHFSGIPEEKYAKGISAAVVSIRRTSPDSLPPSIKSTSCLNQILGRMEADRSGADEAIFLSSKGFITEGSASNVFIVKSGTILTPKLDGSNLAGVTRAGVIEAARSLNLPVREARIPCQSLVSADEIFLSNTTMEIMPVSRIILTFKNGSKSMPVGPISTMLRYQFHALKL